MKTYFFEVQDWEKPLITATFPEAVQITEPLSETLVAQYSDMEVASCFIYSSFSKAVIDNAPNLKLIATRSTGFDHIDAAYAKEKGITVCNVPEYGSRTVAEYAFALMLSLTRTMFPAIEQSRNCNFDHSQLKGVDLFGKTLGVIGLGKIGLEVLKISKGFGMKALVYTRTRDEELAKQYDFTYATLEELLPQSDVITLHLPYSQATHHIINSENILTLKKGAYLINTARGGLVDTAAIMLGLEKEILAGVGLDVIEGEKELTEEVDILSQSSTHAVDFKTLCFDYALLHNPKVIITPHNAFNSHEALVRIEETTFANMKAFIDAKPQNTV